MVVRFDERDSDGISDTVKTSLSEESCTAVCNINILYYQNCILKCIHRFSSCVLNFFILFDSFIVNPFLHYNTILFKKLENFTFTRSDLDTFKVKKLLIDLNV